MALDTYANLKIEIADWSHRSDLTTRIDTFIDMAENEMLYNQVEQLRIREDEARSTATMDSTTPSRYLALPGDFSKMRQLELIDTDSNRFELDYISPSAMKFRDSTGRPCYFTVTSQLEFDIDPDQDYTIEMQYYSRFTALSSSNTTNNVLTNHPNIYLFGALWAVFDFAEQPEISQNYYNKFIGAITGANNEANFGRYGANPAATNDTMIP